MFRLCLYLPMLSFAIILFGIIMLSLFLFLLWFMWNDLLLQVITPLFNIRKCPWEPWAGISFIHYVKGIEHLSEL